MPTFPKTLQALWRRGPY